ncbi:MAG: plasmid pRiA4b ORF-3 family protein [Marmoricola sp.]
MTSDDNVIRMPGRPDGGTPEEAAKALAKQWIADGRDPKDLLAVVLDLGGARAERLIPQRRQPVPAEPRAEKATYRVRVDLHGAKPPIWRRLELAGDLPLSQVHEVLQTAMGWTDSHLHHFFLGPARDHLVEPFLTDFAEDEGDEGIHERDVRLDQTLVEVGDRLFYEYDFGDGWSHTIRLEVVTPYDESTPRAICVAGRRACPPEDCGGIGGYADVLAAIANPGDPDEWMQQLRDWMPDGFDPEAFSVAETDELVQLTLSASLDALTTVIDFDPELADLVEHSPPSPLAPLGSLLGRARLADVTEPDQRIRDALVRPWLILLGMVGDGVPLTQAGFLKPATVSALATELPQVEPWMGKANREEHTPPVAALRSTAVAMGLVRKLKGRLVPTRAGRRILGDPTLMWGHLTGALPLGRQRFERHAGVVALLALAAGESPADGVRRYGPAVLSYAGWQLRDGDDLDPWAVHACALPTLDVLDLAGCGTGPILDRQVTPEGQMLARAALRKDT